MAEPREKAGFSLDRLLGNPELIAGLLSLFGSRLTGEGRTDEIPEPYRDGAEAAAAPYDRRDAGAAEREELPVSAEPEEGGAPPEAAEGEEASIAVSGMPSPPRGKGRGRKREMLCALKPYMSRNRCDMVDRILHAADLVDLFRK